MMQPPATPSESEALPIVLPAPALTAEIPGMNTVPTTAALSQPGASKSGAGAGASDPTSAAA
jgi:hypothetical protein